ncbi:MAG: aminoacyl-tRNA hydrolase [Bdellovibrionales bacterium]|nr:aminoacyl-tRNA hydrolase [Bdellovibrionales bacterium]
MYLIVGLQNPGPRYARTRHNAGAWVVERLAVGVSWKSKYNAAFARTSIGGHDAVLALPQSFMNLSGEPVRRLCDFFKIEGDELVVIHDELDLRPGVVRIKRGGTSSHRGVSDIVGAVGTPDFYRVRIGVGHPRDKEDAQDRLQAVSDYVLQAPSSEEARLLEDAVGRAAEATAVLLEQGLAAAQQHSAGTGRID